MWLLQPISDLLRQLDFLPKYKIVIVSGPIKRSSLAAITVSARQLGIPVIYTRSVGFYSVFSLQLPAEFPVVETHPDPESTQDLRLVNPWPELQAAVGRVSNLETLDDHDHGHVPYIFILLHYLEKWKAEHDGRVPENYQEKRAFRDMVRAGARTSNPEGGEENFDEAAGAVLKSINPWSLRSNIREIFEMEQCRNLTSDSDHFWIIASALSAFHSKHGVLPLPGTLPDMKAQSADYIALQKIYKTKAQMDMAEVLATVRATEAQLGASRTGPIEHKEVEIFCKNASHVKVIQGLDIPRLGDSSAPPRHTTRTALRNGLENPESLITIYIAFEALDTIVDGIQSGQLPPTALDDDTTWESTTHRLLALLGPQRGDDETETAVDEEQARERTAQAVQELRRTAGGELHNISALTGGLVAQEALKVLTRQYVPLENTCIFDGIGSRSEMFRL